MIDTVIQQHSEEASFLWLLRNEAIEQPHYDLGDLAELDYRLDAHIDALRISGDAGWEICREALAVGEAGEVFTAAVLAFATGEIKRFQAILKVSSREPGLSKGFISAIGWLDWQQAEKIIHNFAISTSSDLRRMSLAACAIHRSTPGQVLIDSLSSDDFAVQARALKAVGELRLQELLPLLQDNFSVEERKCRFYAAWSAALLSDSGAIAVLQDIAESDSEYVEKSSAMVLRSMKLEDSHGWLRELSQNKGKTRLSIQGVGVVGDPVSVPWLIEVMQMPEFARVASESFSMITGADLAYDNLAEDWPEGFEAGPSEDPEDENVEMDADENLPWPNVALIAKWWNEKKEGFRVGTRYLVGKPISAEYLQQVLRTGYQRQRAAAALELAILQPGMPLFEVRAPGFRQQKILGLK